MLYFKGHGVSQDFRRAAIWQRLAADQGNWRGQFNLGLAYYRGEGVPQDFVKAHSWINLAAACAPSALPHEQFCEREHYAKVRDEIAAKLTPHQLVEAQGAARDWTTEFEEREGDGIEYGHDE